MSTAICTAKPSTLNIIEVYIAAILLELSLQQHLVGDEQKIVKDVFLAGKVSSTGTAAAVKRPSEKNCADSSSFCGSRRLEHQLFGFLSLVSDSPQPYNFFLLRGLVLMSSHGLQAFL